MNAVFEAVRAGKIRPTINQRFPLEQVQDAHRALEGARDDRGHGAVAVKWRAGRIRTPGTLARSPVFKTGAINRSGHLART